MAAALGEGLPAMAILASRVGAAPAAAALRGRGRALAPAAPRAFAAQPEPGAPPAGTAPAAEPAAPDDAPPAPSAARAAAAAAAPPSAPAAAWARAAAGAPPPARVRSLFADLEAEVDALFGALIPSHPLAPFAPRFRGRHGALPGPFALLSGPAFGGGGGSAAAPAAGVWPRRLAADVTEGEAAWVIEADAPGMCAAAAATRGAPLSGSFRPARASPSPRHPPSQPAPRPPSHPAPRSAADVSVTLHEGVLTIRGERASEETKEQARAPPTPPPPPPPPPPCCTPAGRPAPQPPAPPAFRKLPPPPRAHHFPPLGPPPTATQDGARTWVERSRGAFVRSFALPDDSADAGGITASVKDGVVTVTVPKAPAPPKPQPKRIPVAAA